MSIVQNLSSQIGDRTERSNIAAAVQCLSEPKLLKEISIALINSDAKLAGDCAEVFTKVAEERPELVVPYAEVLGSLLEHKSNRVRWEVVHALALIAGVSGTAIERVIPRLAEMVKKDGSTIVRDYAVDAIGNYAGLGELESAVAYPILKESLTVWDGKHAGHALEGLANVARYCPFVEDELYSIGIEYTGHSRGVINKAAKALLKAINGKTFKTFRSETGCNSG